MLDVDSAQKLQTLRDEATTRRILTDVHNNARIHKLLERRKAWQALRQALRAIIALELPQRTA